MKLFERLIQQDKNNVNTGRWSCKLITLFKHNLNYKLTPINFLIKNKTRYLVLPKHRFVVALLFTLETNWNLSVNYLLTL